MDALGSTANWSCSAGEGRRSVRVLPACRLARPSMLYRSSWLIAPADEMNKESMTGVEVGRLVSSNGLNVLMHLLLECSLALV